MAVTATGPVALWRPAQDTKRGLQVALEKPLPQLVHNLSDRNLAAQAAIELNETATTTPAPAPATEATAAAGGVATQAQAATLSVVQGLNALTAPLMAAIKTENTATDVFWVVVEKVKTGLSAFMPLTVSISFKSTAPATAETTCTSPVPITELELSLPTPKPSLPEEREQAILKQLCMSEDTATTQPLIFSARSIESYVAARKASQEASLLQQQRQQRRSLVGLFGPGKVLDPRPFVQLAVQRVFVDALLAPVASWTRAVERRPSGFAAWMGSPEDDGTSSRDNKWGSRALRIAGTVLVYDMVLLGVAYLLWF